MLLLPDQVTYKPPQLEKVVKLKKKKKLKKKIKKRRKKYAYSQVNLGMLALYLMLTWVS